MKISCFIVKLLAFKYVGNLMLFHSFTARIFWGGFLWEFQVYSSALLVLCLKQFGIEYSSPFPNFSRTRALCSVEAWNSSEKCLLVLLPLPQYFVGEIPECPRSFFLLSCPDQRLFAAEDVQLIDFSQHSCLLHHYHT